MANKNNQPFTISRSNSSRSNFSFLDKSLSNSFEEPSFPALKKPSAFLQKQNSLLMQPAAAKTSYSIYKTDLNLMPDLLDKYSQANLYYRDEEFTQQAENFVMKIAIEKRIPKEFKARYPLYQIMIAVCKVFMLNEFEIVTFACTLDHCNWKIDEVIYPDEHYFLEEFPANFGVDIDESCKRFIMYLMILTFSIKQHLNEKSEIDPIQAYCEKICVNFQPIFNRWARLSSLQRFTYSAVEINRKFKCLCKRGTNEQTATPKDYNMLVETIMSLTGSYNSKTKGGITPDPVPAIQSQYQNIINSRTQILQNFFPPAQSFEPRVLFSEGPLSIGLDNKGLSRQMTIESTDDPAQKSQAAYGYSRQGSLSQLLTNFSALKRQDSSSEISEKENKKKIKWEMPTMDSQETEDLNKENASTRQHDNGGIGGSQGEGDDFFIPLNLPNLSKKASNLSQPPDELPGFSRFNSNLSFLYDNNKQ